MEETCSVLITGGAGFLGQHVVGLLQTKADHVTEIRVLDPVAFENKLDYVHTKPVKSCVGSITDENILKKACHGVKSVIHIAGIPDASMFPDKNKINEVDIQGTLLTLLTALGTTGVQRFINCSSMSVAIGNTVMTEGITENDPVPSRRLFEPYASSKLAGERLVLAANSESFRALSLRPLVMWGELDIGYVQVSQEMAARTWGYLPQVNCGDVEHHGAYVGNTAWGFFCAEIKLHKDIKKGRSISETLSPSKDELSRSKLCSELRRRSRTLQADAEVGKTDHDELNTTPDGSENTTANVYYIADETPAENLFKFQEPFLNSTGYKLIKYPCPLFIIIIAFHVIYVVLLFLRFFGLKVNFPVSLGICDYYKTSYTFSDAKAREELDYKPIYTPTEAMERSLKYYKKFAYKAK